MNEHLTHEELCRAQTFLNGLSVKERRTIERSRRRVQVARHLDEDKCQVVGAEVNRFRDEHGRDWLSVFPDGRTNV